jgi:hypothetical protein
MIIVFEKFAAGSPMFYDVRKPLPWWIPVDAEPFESARLWARATPSVTYFVAYREMSLT